jgi:hypothetical protein
MMNAQAQTQASQLQYQAAQQALAQQQAQWEATQKEQLPWLNLGTNAANLLSQANQPGGTQNLYANFAGSPEYQYIKDQAMGATLGRGAAAGQYFSGGMGLGLGAEAGQLANQNLSGYLNQLGAESGIGQTTATTLGNLGSTYAQNYGNTVMQGANAQAGGLVGAANARSAMFQNMQGSGMQQAQLGMNLGNFFSNLNYGGYSAPMYTQGGFMGSGNPQASQLAQNYAGENTGAVTPTFYE